MKWIRISAFLVLSAILLTMLAGCTVSGESAYEIAVRHGYTGSEAEWIASLQGASGEDGKNGVDGDDGKNGADGVGVEKVEIDDEGYLIVTLTNGKTFNAGYVGTASADTSGDAPVLNVERLSLPMGNSYILTADLEDVTFVSSAPSVIQISRDGVLLAIAEGTATITATSRNGKSAVCYVDSTAYVHKTQSDGGVSIVGYNGNLAALTIPEDIMGMPVKEIGDSAFRNCSSIASVIIPDGVTIGEYAFADCEKLSEVLMGDSCAYDEETSFSNTPWYKASVWTECQETVWVYPTNNDGVYLPGAFSNYYSEPTRESTVKGSLKDGTELLRTGIILENAAGDGWSRVVYNGETVYMRNSQIGTTAPDRPNAGENIYFYDPSSIPEGMLAIIPLDLSLSEKGVGYINDFSDSCNPDLESIMGIDVSSVISSSEPLVLILHTHATEAYTADGVTYYSPSNSTDPRSNDPTKTVVSLGALLAQRLNTLGIPTLHCDIMHDSASYDAAYANSAETIARYLAEYPSIKYVIDLHRDSVELSNGDIVKPVVEVNGLAAAQVMCVVGSGVDGASRWEGNLALAQKLRAGVGEGNASLCRPTYFSDKGYNQQLSTYSLLLEIGASGNTLDEAKLAVEQIAPALAAVIKGE